MRKIAFLILVLAGLAGYSQEVGDATIQTYVDTYLNTNGTGSITGAELNQGLSYLIDSKVNKDSATTVRIAPTNDTLFITYWGYTEDTIPVSVATNYWALNGTDLYPSSTSYDVGIGMTNPTEELHVTGDIRSTDTIFAGTFRGDKGYIDGDFTVDDDFFALEGFYIGSQNASGDTRVVFENMPTDETADTILCMEGDTVFRMPFTPSGVTINGNTNNNLITATGITNTLQGEEELTFNSAANAFNFTINNGYPLFHMSNYHLSAYPYLQMTRFDGVLGSYTGVDSGEELGIIQWGGSISNSSYDSEGVRLTAEANENWSSGVTGSKFTISTNVTGASTLMDNLTIADSVTTIYHILKLEPMAAAPSDASEGMIYVNSTTHHIYCYLNGSWTQLD